MATVRTKVKVEPSERRVRVIFGGVTIVDTIAARLVWEGPVPHYGFSLTDVQVELRDAGLAEDQPGLGTRRYFDVGVGEAVARSAAWTYDPPAIDSLAGLVRFDFEAMDAWFEEDEQIYVHPRDPYKRVDIIQSSRHVLVQLEGVTVAESRRPTLLFETGLPVRYYVPKLDVSMNMLEPTDLTTSCPYKGDARYWTVLVDGHRHENVVWGYDFPIPEAAKIQGLVCFYNEKVDIHVDGELQPRPQTFWS